MALALAPAIITMALDLAMTTMALAMTTMALETMERFGVVDTQPKAVQLAPRDTVQLGAMETVPGKMTSVSQQISSETTMGLETTMALVRTTMETTMALDTTMALVQSTMETTMALDTTMALVQITMGLETTMGPVTTLGMVQITRSNTYVRCTCTFDNDYLGLTQQNAAISGKNDFSFSTSDLTLERH